MKQLILTIIIPFSILTANSQVIIIDENGSGKNQKEIIKKKKKSKSKDNKKTFFYTAIGTGTGYGGKIGLKAGVRFGSVDLHIAGGIIPMSNSKYSALYSDVEPKICVNGGIKIFPFKKNNLYIDAMFGQFASAVYNETNTKTESGGYGSYTRTDIAYGQYYIYGPSLVVGYDWIFSKHIGLNAGLGMSYNIAEPHINWDYYGVKHPTTMLALDLGLIIKF